MKKEIIILLLSIVLVSCSKNNDSNKKNDHKIFESLSHLKTKIDFQNLLNENDSLNYMNYAYMYMGGGISVGDINNDGLKDVYFTGNMVSNKLYLNKGNLEFEDITESAGVGGDNRWYTGATMADVNGDGFLDIYCSVSGKFKPKVNQLFINNGDGTFLEKAEEYGLDDISSSVQGTFFDYDKDGDLDLYVANYPPMPFNAPEFSYKFRMANLKHEESDHLYRNDGGKFTDVSLASGIKNFGLSLSATIGDLNNDSWPDIYVSNDFMSPDYMFINNHDGTFKEVIKQATSHTAFYGMGVDISDINNDGNLDIFQVDMDAKTNRRKKANMASMNPRLFWSTVNSGFHYQYMHNTLQLNSGFTKEGIPHFSNISRLTGTSSTDWSWGPLFADFDNDGYKDLYVSNGTRREVNNNDFFDSIKTVKLKKEDLLELSLKIPSEKIDNFMYKNNGNLDFERANKRWGIEFEGFSNGVVYADLDNDGDLEIITNNIDDYAAVFENKSSETNNYITVKFEGGKGNKVGLGNRVYVKTGENNQLQELTLTRGFQSSVAPELHFGLSNFDKIDELKVVWVDGKTQVLNNVSVNQTLVFKNEDAIEITEQNKELKNIFDSSKSNLFPVHKHTENYNDDFEKQVLLPHKMSMFGPALAVGDLNGDGLDDYFVGGASNYSGEAFYQTETGFVKKEITALEEDAMSEDIGAIIFDADLDGDNDLYVVSGGYEFNVNSKRLQDRLYINTGQGEFVKAKEGVLPSITSSGSKVYNIDFDKDGKEDLLVLGRQVPGDYPKPTSSYILKNNSTKENVLFEDVTTSSIKEFENLGMATSAIITDFNKDDWQDIIIVGEWMPIRVFKNIKTGFKEVTKEMGLNNDTTGWWWSIQEGDFDKDGDMDYIVGNNGLNYKYKASDEETFDIFINDFDRDNKDDIVLSYYNDGEQYPVRGRECSSQQIPAIKKKFENYESFSEATLVDVYTKNDLEKSIHYQVKSFASVYLENDNGKFNIHKLPIEAQMSSINQILINDYDNDGNLDALLAGNLYASEVETPRNDGSYGVYLKGSGNGTFVSIPSIESGFFTPGDVKDMATIKVKDDEYIISAKNDDFLQFTKILK
ncbi:FG-GAP-like repeat-containing protein [Urechidicola croceus]|uniref:ASPIC/UnbV domain-containing protein n=1 Tax=Urechidicola croceus TaxID=1850246 RepID=A0A1D8PAA9_9FLAO|nr:FG-GAP-like repeat-containing protein [Urechidicola croceus]AOW21529.1 hypothetical protein LPB138_12940 [Urechidicola croceus]